MSSAPQSRHDHLAGNLCRLRRVAGLTQAELAGIAAVPRATLASMEQGRGSPGLDKVIAVAEALNVSLEELVLPGPATRHHLVCTAEVKPTRTDSGRFVAQQISPLATRGVMIQHVNLLPGCDAKGRLHPRGAQEFFFVYSGHAMLTIDRDEVEVPAGSLVQFPGHLPHRYGNRSCGDEVRAVATIVMALS